jgi:hypothetical protein
MVTILKQITVSCRDNPNDITDTKYGNNNVMGPDKKRNPSRNARSRNCGSV